MVLQIISWHKFFVRRIDGLTKTSKLQLETRPTITAIALQTPEIMFGVAFRTGAWQLLRFKAKNC